jgi:hypothetical protein
MAGTIGHGPLVRGGQDARGVGEHLTFEAFKPGGEFLDACRFADRIDGTVSTLKSRAA